MVEQQRYGIVDVWDAIIIFAIVGLSLQYSSTTYSILLWYIPHFVLGSIYITLKMIITLHRGGYNMWSLAPTKEEIKDGMLGGAIGFVILYFISAMFPLIASSLAEAVYGIDPHTFLIVVLFQAMAEELLWRGVFPFAIAIVLYPITKKLYERNLTALNPKKLALAGGQFFGAIMFGVRHVATYITLYGFYIGLQFVMLAIISGMILGVIALRYGLWASIMAHRFYNMAVIIGLMI